jgi:hypothetical protein
MAKTKPYEGSLLDKREDKLGAKKLGKSLKAYEKTSRDKREDRIGSKKQRNRQMM